jgi:Flp pilus assembly protein TadG
MTIHTQRVRARRGANAVEFALTLPVFLMLVLGTMDYGLIFMTQAGLDSAVSIGCREGAMVDPLLADPTITAHDQVVALANYWCADTPCDITVTDSGGPTAPVRTLECRISRETKAIIGFVPAPVELESVSQYRLEWQRST